MYAHEDAEFIPVHDTTIDLGEEKTSDETKEVAVNGEGELENTNTIDSIDDREASEETKEMVASIEGFGNVEVSGEMEEMDSEDEAAMAEEFLNTDPGKITDIGLGLEGILAAYSTGKPAEIDSADLARTGLDFQGLVSAIAEAKQRPRPDDRTELVQEEEKLDLDQVATAICAITEALHLQDENDANFSLISSTTIHEAQKQPPGEYAQSIRPGSQLIMFPWVHNAAQLKYASGFHLDDYDAEFNAAYCNAHIFLVIVKKSMGPLYLPTIRFQDSLPGYWAGREDEYNLMKGYVRRSIANFGTVGPPHIVNHGVSTGSSIPFESLEDLGYKERSCTTQNGWWQCGLHTILSAWATALGFQIDSECEMEEERYTMVVDVVNLVLDGHATCAMVVGLLNAIGFVEPLEVHQKPKYFLGELREKHNIRSTSSLNELILKERNAEANRLDWLIRTARYEDRPGAPGPKPTLKPIETKKHQKTIDDPLISPSTIGHFLMNLDNQHPEVQAGLKHLWVGAIRNKLVRGKGGPSIHSLDRFRSWCLFGDVNPPSNETVQQREARFKAVVANIERKAEASKEEHVNEEGAGY